MELFEAETNNNVQQNICNLPMVMNQAEEEEYDFWEDYADYNDEEGPSTNLVSVSSIQWQF